MLRIFKKPFHKESLEAWCKICDDIAKVSILTIPVVLYGTGDILHKVGNVSVLFCVAYIFLFSADLMRKNKENLVKE